MHFAIWMALPVVLAVEVALKVPTAASYITWAVLMVGAVLAFGVKLPAVTHLTTPAVMSTLTATISTFLRSLDIGAGGYVGGRRRRNGIRRSCGGISG